ncbi:MAG: DUF885 domain-containing protein [Microbacteriaceae bacterium]|jgi:uncharacterized protein (DUF885 family)|nr:DUF885 domain-containing protein [Microbacteriaceae bacterium]
MSTTDAALQTLSDEYWLWRASEQPQTDDDIPRLLRPAGWRPAWDPESVAGYRRALDGFEDRWAAISLPDPQGASPAERATIVDHALLGSAIARARFELDVTRAWERDPGFTVDQAAGVYFTLLRDPAPFTPSRTAAILAALRDVPRVLDEGLANLRGHATEEPTRLAAETLRTAAGMGGGESLRCSSQALAEVVPPDQAGQIRSAGQAAGDALDAFARALETLDTAPWHPIGEDLFREFLRTVALNPADPQELLLVGRLEYERAVAFSVIESRGHRASSGRTEPREELPLDTQTIVERQHAQEAEIRRFYESRGLLSQPATLRHYLLELMPDYLAPLQWLGVTDFIEWECADRGAVSYQPDTEEGLGFFDDAIGRDPMTGLIHEGCHSQQLALSAANPDPIRRHYYDSGANEGIGYYNEEMLSRAGLFAGSPDSQETIHAFLRLRALRVSIDIRLALGRLSIPDAAAELARSVPMDAYTAGWEASFFAKTPGQGMTYQVGKTQILAFLTAVSSEPGFSLQDFHDRLWSNGNVPIALQRYEWTGDASALGDIRL